MLYMTVVEYDDRVVPVTVVDVHLALVRKVHCIVNTDLLPFLELCRCMSLFPSLYVDKLILRTCNVRYVELRMLYYMIKHTAVSAL